jgi:hypothetical protein
VWIRLSLVRSMQQASSLQLPVIPVVSQEQQVGVQSSRIQDDSFKRSHAVLDTS